MTTSATLLARHPGAKPPGPGGGELVRFLLRRKKEPLGFFRALAGYGDLARFRVGQTDFYLLNHPDHARRVFVEKPADYSKGAAANRMRPVLGMGLLTSEGELWKRQRKIIQPAFHRESLARMESVLREETARFLENWRPAARAARPLDVFAEMMHLNMTLAARALLGSSLHGRERDIERAITDLLHITEARATSPLRLLELIPALGRRPRLYQAALRLPTRNNRRYAEALGELDSLVYGIIDARRREGSSRHDVLGLLLGAVDEATGRGMEDRQLRDEVMTFFLAGHETTATAMTWTFAHLSRHPEALDLALREPLAVFQEAMRLNPPIWRIARRAEKEDCIGGYRIPAGSVVLVLPLLLHRHPDFWSRPEAFDPGRFLRNEPSHKQAYIPFGAGQRMCVGYHFAFMEARIILSETLRRYRLELVPGREPVPEAGITLRPRGGLFMRVREMT